MFAIDVGLAALIVVGSFSYHGFAIRRRMKTGELTDPLSRWLLALGLGWILAVASVVLVITFALLISMGTNGFPLWRSALALAGLNLTGHMAEVAGRVALRGPHRT